MNQTAHISLQILAMSNSVETKETRCALNLPARPASITSDFLLLPADPNLRVSASVRPVRRPVSASAPPVKGVLRLVDDARKQFFEENRPEPHFFPFRSNFSGHSSAKLLLLNNLRRIYQKRIFCASWPFPAFSPPFTPGTARTRGRICPDCRC